MGFIEREKQMRTKFTVTIAVLCLAVGPWAGKVIAVCCPFCSAVSQTLRQEMAAMDTVAIARIVPGSETDSDAKFSVVSVLRGDKLVTESQELTINYFGKAKTDQRFLVMGVDPPELLWSSPLPVSEVAVNYIEAIHALSEDSMERLNFYMDYLEHEEPLIARDAYDEFASASYADIKKLKPKMNREQLIEWIKDTSLPHDRKRLYLVMLGVCGREEDTEFLEQMLRSEDPNQRGGLDAMIACYVTLKGDSGLDLIDELFLLNKDSQYADTWSAIMALRFHGTDGGVIEQERVLKSIRLILDRPDLADLVIPDLARWEDWSQIEKLAELFRTADVKSSWVRVPVINYLRACPLPEAKEQLEELKELDPASFKRATSFFPMPKPSAESTDSSSTLETRTVGHLATDVSQPSWTQPTASILPAAATGPKTSPALGAGVVVAGPNRWWVVCVVSMAAVTMWLTMWLAISGAGRPSVVAATSVE